jgi:hypothetical protein
MVDAIRDTGATTLETLTQVPLCLRGAKNQSPNTPTIVTPSVTMESPSSGGLHVRKTCGAVVPQPLKWSKDLFCELAAA